MSSLFLLPKGTTAGPPALVSSYIGLKISGNLKYHYNSTLLMIWELINWKPISSWLLVLKWLWITLITIASLALDHISKNYFLIRCAPSWNICYGQRTFVWLTCQPATRPRGWAKRGPEGSDQTQIGYRLAGQARHLWICFVKVQRFVCQFFTAVHHSLQRVCCCCSQECTALSQITKNDFKFQILLKKSKLLIWNQNQNYSFIYSTCMSMVNISSLCTLDKYKLSPFQS